MHPIRGILDQWVFMDSSPFPFMGKQPMFDHGTHVPFNHMFPLKILIVPFYMSMFWFDLIFAYLRTYWCSLTMIDFSCIFLLLSQENHQTFPSYCTPWNPAHLASHRLRLLVGGPIANCIQSILGLVRRTSVQHDLGSIYIYINGFSGAPPSMDLDGST